MKDGTKEDAKSVYYASNSTNGSLNRPYSRVPSAHQEEVLYLVCSPTKNGSYSSQADSPACGGSGFTREIRRMVKQHTTPKNIIHLEELEHHLATSAQPGQVETKQSMIKRRAYKDF